VRKNLLPVAILAVIEAGCVAIVAQDLGAFTEIVPWLGWGAGVAVTAALYPLARRLSVAPVLTRPLLFFALGAAGFLATAFVTVLLLAWIDVVLDLPAPGSSVVRGAVDLTTAAPLIAAAVVWEYLWVPLVVSLAAWVLVEAERPGRRLRSLMTRARRFR
jgi:hypothetical protein